MFLTKYIVEGLSKNLDRQTATFIVGTIIADLSGRSSFDHAWGILEEEGRDGDVRNKWIEIVESSENPEEVVEKIITDLKTRGREGAASPALSDVWQDIENIEDDEVLNEIRQKWMTIVGKGSEIGAAVEEELPAEIRAVQDAVARRKEFDEQDRVEFPSDTHPDIDDSPDAIKAEALVNVIRHISQRISNELNDQ